MQSIRCLPSQRAKLTTPSLPPVRSECDRLRSATRHGEKHRCPKIGMPSHGEIGEVTEIGRSAGVHSFEWTIPGFASLPAECGDSYRSPSFSACDGKWRSHIYPNRKSAFSARWVDLVLCRFPGLQPLTSHVTFGVKTAEGVEGKKEVSQEFSDDDRLCCLYGFCRRSRLEREKSRWMPGDVLTLAFDVRRVLPIVAKDSSTQTTEDDTETGEHHFSKKQGVEELTESLRGLLSGGEDSDVLLKVRGKEFPAHRAILRARSTVFEAMFTHDMVEKQSGVVKMDDCDPESFPAFLEHVYTGSTGMLSTKNVFSLYDASDKYDLRVLKKACTKFLKINLSVSCFCNAVALAVKHDEKELIEHVTEFFCRNSLEIVKTVEWQIFLKENTTIGNELIIKAFSK